ncbi:MAG: DNA-binding response regulator [Chloroflexota bacterium]
MARILVVEDEPLTAEMLAALLQQEGYQVAIGRTGAEALRLARDQDPAVILLDIGLPDLSGVEVCRRLREFSGAEILMVTARRQETDKVVGLDAGADDYITKPYSPAELLARIRAALRRRCRSQAQVRRLGDVMLDLAGRRVWIGETEVALSPREFDLLAALARRPGEAFSRQALLDQVWGPGYVGDDKVVDVYIASLRRKLGDNPDRPQLIQTVRGYGYRLAARPSE